MIRNCGREKITITKRKMAIPLASASKIQGQVETSLSWWPNRSVSVVLNLWAATPLKVTYLISYIADIYVTAKITVAAMEILFCMGGLCNMGNVLKGSIIGRLSSTGPYFSYKSARAV